MLNLFSAETITDYLVTIIERGVYIVLVLIACALIIKFSRKFIKMIFNEKMANSRHIDTGQATTLGAVTYSVIKYVVIFFGICIILVNLGIPATTLAAVLGTGTVAIGLGAQNVIKDIIAGFLILLENQFAVGDIITIGDKTGVVEDISIRTTQIRSPNGTLHIIPNGGITVVSNMCKEYINAIVEVDVAYEEDLQKVIGILNDEMVIAGKELKEIRTTPIVLGVADLADSGVTIKIIAECDIKQNYNIERELRLRIKNRFDAEGITIPFPQRVVHMAEKKEV